MAQDAKNLVSSYLKKKLHYLIFFDRCWKKLPLNY
jgi:hypothetical protein